MRTFNPSGPALTAYALLFMAAAQAACGPSDTGGPGDDLPPPVEGNAYLTIVGDRDVFVEAGGQQAITVKYHDASGQPLAGQVAFHIEGTAQGGILSDDSGVTDAEGLVHLTVLAGYPLQAAFRVIANAEFATPVDWRVAVAQQPPPVAPLDASGSYDVQSQFDLVSGIPGTTGTVINTILDMTDGPNDPATWLIDEAVDNLDSGFLEGLVDAARPALDAFLNDAILSYSPDFVSTFVNVGDDLGQITRKFGLVSKMEIIKGGPDGSELHAKQTVTGVVYMVDGVEYEYTMYDLSLGQMVADNIPVAMVNETKLTIADHTLPLSYGHIILFGLNNVVIPAIDPWSHSLEDLLNHYVDCTSIGYSLSDYIGFGSPGLYESACQTGIAAVSAIIEEQILSIDSTGAALVIHGDAKPMDTNGDRVVDKLQAGLWEGTMTFGPIDSVLAKPEQKFTATRRAIP